MVRSGNVSSRELVQHSLDTVAAQQADLDAFVYVDTEGALAAADQVDRARTAGEQLGPLAGVPFGVKDLEDCTGMPTTRGSRWCADAPPAQRDDIHVARFRAAGTIPIGKTATPRPDSRRALAGVALRVTRATGNITQTWWRVAASGACRPAGEEPGGARRVVVVALVALTELPLFPAGLLVEEHHRDDGDGQGGETP